MVSAQGQRFIELGKLAKLFLATCRGLRRRKALFFSSVLPLWSEPG